MRVGVPTDGNRGMDESIGEHFGRVQTYTLIDIESEKVRVIPNTSNHMGGDVAPPELLRKEGVDVLVCRGIGRRAISMFSEFGIDVFIGASGTVSDALEEFKTGKLHKASENDACEQHAFSDHHSHM